jgi:hypothetical protein
MGCVAGAAGRRGHFMAEKMGAVWTLGHCSKNGLKIYFISNIFVYCENYIWALVMNC